MNFVEEEGENYDKEEQEHEEEEGGGGEDEEDEEIITSTSKLPFPSRNSASSSSPTKYRNFLPQHQNLWLSSSDLHSQQDHKSQESSFNFEKKLDLVHLSLGNDNTITSGGGSVEREHMFDKAVTPSDVGKLNRLVIPKQHAEKFFPLDSSSNEKGMLLNFDDRNGKTWRFRYSYWNSSQSYVMTKGWSRFVKEKKLDAGDIVSFQRGIGESGKHHLYIDWRRRPNAPDPTSFANLELKNQLTFPQSVRWGKLYSLPHQLNFQPFNYHSVQPYHPNHHGHHHYHYHHHHNQQHGGSHGNPTTAGCYFRPPAQPLPSPQGGIQIGGVHQQAGGNHQKSVVIDSIPVVHGRNVGKRLRLFGVNMECPTQDHDHLGSLSPALASGQSVLPSSSSISTPTSRQAADYHQHQEFLKKGKTSLSFDLDL